MRNSIRIDDDNELAMRAREGRIDVAGLGMAVIGTRQVLTAQPSCKFSNLLAIAVVEQVGAMWILDGVAAGQGCLQHFDIFVVGRHEYIDGAAREWLEAWCSACIPGHEGEQAGVDDAVDLGGQQEY